MCWSSTPATRRGAHAAALQIAALKAKYLTRDEVPEDVVASERRIAEETAREEGKPEQALPKIIEGRLTGFYKDVVLLDQPSVSDNKKTVKALLDEAGVTVTRFVRFEVGQGAVESAGCDAVRIRRRRARRPRCRRLGRGDRCGRVAVPNSSRPPSPAPKRQPVAEWVGVRGFDRARAQADAPPSRLLQRRADVRQGQRRRRRSADDAGH